MHQHLAGEEAAEVVEVETVRTNAMSTILQGDCLDVLPTLPDAFARLIYIDPPFNTGKSQKRERIRTTQSANGTRKGFAGRRYTTERIGSSGYSDSFDDYLAFLMPRIEASLHCLTADGSLFVHLDYREVHDVKVALDTLLGRERFMNEIIWAYDYGGRPRNRWPAKHDTILWYAVDPTHLSPLCRPSESDPPSVPSVPSVVNSSSGGYIFNYDAIDRIPYMAPGLVTPEKAARGKTPTDVWWHTIVPTNSREKTGYPTQKPLGILRRIVGVHTLPGDTVLDFFAGSGTTGAAAAELGRGFVLIDASAEAVQVMQQRLRYNVSTLVTTSATSRRTQARRCRQQDE
jgi:site-specific DNA-methyltransferase (adenine-specific)